LARSFRFARRIALAMNGATSLPKPFGSPRFRNVIRVRPPAADSHVYVVSIGNGPWLVRMTSRASGSSSTISDVYARRRPRTGPQSATREPSASGGGVCHSTDSMFTYHVGALSGSRAYAATAATGRSMTISVTTSTGMSFRLVASGDDRDNVVF